MYISQNEKTTLRIQRITFGLFQFPKGSNRSSGISGLLGRLLPLQFRLHPLFCLSNLKPRCLPIRTVDNTRLLIDRIVNSINNVMYYDIKEYRTNKQNDTRDLSFLTSVQLRIHMENPKQKFIVSTFNRVRTGSFLTLIFTTFSLLNSLIPFKTVINFDTRVRKRTHELMSLIPFVFERGRQTKERFHGPTEGFHHRTISTLTRQTSRETSYVSGQVKVSFVYPRPFSPQTLTLLLPYSI